MKDNISYSRKYKCHEVVNSYIPLDTQAMQRPTGMSQVKITKLVCEA